MGRNKVKLEWVESDSARKNIFKKMGESLFKKMKELTILCNVNGFVIVYAPDSNEPAMWPADRRKVEESLMRFQNIPKFEQWKKMTNQETYLKQRTTKMEEKIKKHQKKNSEMEMSEKMHQMEKGKPFDAFDTSELTSLVLFFEERMNEIKQIVDYFKQGALPPPHESEEANRSVSQIGGNALLDGCNNLGQEEYLQRENLKQIENTDDIGLAPQTYFGSSLNVANDLGLPIGNFAGNGFGLPIGSVNQYGSGMEWPYGNLGVRSDKSDIGLSEVNYEDITCGSEIGLPQVMNYGDIYGGSELGQSQVNCGGMISGSDMAQPQVNYEGIFGESEMGQPQVNYGSTASGSKIGLGMLPCYKNDLEHHLIPQNDNIGWGVTGKSVGFSRDEDGVGHLPNQDDVIGDCGLPSRLFRSNNGGSDVGLAPSLFGGSSGGSDVELLYDVSKTWQNPFSP